MILYHVESSRCCCRQGTRPPAPDLARNSEYATAHFKQFHTAKGWRIAFNTKLTSRLKNTAQTSAWSTGPAEEAMPVEHTKSAYASTFNTDKNQHQRRTHQLPPSWWIESHCKRTPQQATVTRSGPVTSRAMHKTTINEVQKSPDPRTTPTSGCHAERNSDKQSSADRGQAQHPRDAKP